MVSDEYVRSRSGYLVTLMRSVPQYRPPKKKKKEEGEGPVQQDHVDFTNLL